MAGTHGKTTTTGLLVHVLREAGLDPGFLVGGVLVGEEATAGLGTGPVFAVEGDEYDAAYFDKRPKMILYRPHRAIVTSLEFDHADIYADWAEYKRAFHAFAALAPARRPAGPQRRGRRGPRSSPSGPGRASASTARRAPSRTGRRSTWPPAT